MPVDETAADPREKTGRGLGHLSAVVLKGYVRLGEEERDLACTEIRG